MALSTKPAAFYADFGGLTSLKGAAKNQDPKALREAARQFESLFTQTMLKTMRQASDALPTGESLMDNDQSKMYLEMFDNQLALQLSKGRGLGLADMLVRQLGPQLGQSDRVEPKTEAKVNSFAIPTVKKTMPRPVDLAPVKNTSRATQDQHFVPLSLPYLQETLSEPRTTPSFSTPEVVPVKATNGAPLSDSHDSSVIPLKSGTPDPDAETNRLRRYLIMRCELRGTPHDS